MRFCFKLISGVYDSRGTGSSEWLNLIIKDVQFVFNVSVFDIFSKSLTLTCCCGVFMVRLYCNRRKLDMKLYPREQYLASSSNISVDFPHPVEPPVR